MVSIQGRPSASALQNLLQQHPIPAGSPHEPHLHHLALQIAHNLRYQHRWSGVRLHYDATSDSYSDARRYKQPLPRPLISGLPPQRLYVHPDEQIELLQRQKDEGKVGMPVVKAEREWVLPSHLREKWTLGRLAGVFDGVGSVPGAREGEELFDGEDDDEGAEKGGDGEGEENEWRTGKPKRLLLATLDDDSTVVYYIVHDGIVKPRQN